MQPLHTGEAMICLYTAKNIFYHTSFYKKNKSSVLVLKRGTTKRTAAKSFLSVIEKNHLERNKTKKHSSQKPETPLRVTKGEIRRLKFSQQGAAGGSSHAAVALRFEGRSRRPEVSSCKTKTADTKGHDQKHTDASRSRGKTLCVFYDESCWVSRSETLKSVACICILYPWVKTLS